jgi:hypothetical protein
MRRVSSNSNCRFLKQVNRPLRLDGNRIRSPMASLSERDFGSKNRQFACRDSRHRLVAASSTRFATMAAAHYRCGRSFFITGQRQDTGKPFIKSDRPYKERDRRKTLLERPHLWGAKVADTSLDSNKTDWKPNHANSRRN